MKMYLHFDYGMDYVLFHFWRPDTALQMLYTCFVLFLVGIIYESVVYSRVLVNSKQAFEFIEEAGYRRRLLNRLHFLQTALHALQYVLSYYLMLVAMTYQVYFIWSIIAGVAVGYWIFTPLSARLKAQSAMFGDVAH